MPIEPTKYKDIVYEGATFPDDLYKKVTVKLNATIVNEYLPAIPANLSIGLRLLITAMTHAEGFRPGTRSYKFKNPGNLGNTDGGSNKGFPTLTAGIEAQAKFIQDVAVGNKKAFPLGKPKKIAPYYSEEVAKNFKTYQTGPYFPGYNFTYTGQLDQFIKIYAVFSRKNNSYINIVVSFFALNGITIFPTDTLKEIIDRDIQDVAAVIGGGASDTPR